MNNPSFRVSLFIPILFIFLISCGVVGTPAPTPDMLGTVVAGTLTSIPVIPTQVAATPFPITFTPIVIPTNSTMEAFGSRIVHTQAQNVNLRVNPGRLFKVSRVLAQGTKLQVLGSAPGGEWLNVVNEEGIIGWVGVDFVAGGFGTRPPVIDPKEVLIVTGTVFDVNGKPISGIGFTITQGSQRDDFSTDETGTFYGFLPTKLSGTWNIGFTSVACTSNTMDTNCKCIAGLCGKPDPGTTTFTLPQSAPLKFTWK
jgi:hypothetical protein